MIEMTPPTSQSPNAAVVSIDWLHQPAQPPILAQLFRVPATQIYAMRKNGQLPVSPQASYSEAIGTYITYLQKRANAKDVEGQEELTKAQTENLKTRTALSRLELFEKRGELIDRDKIGLVLESAFLRLRDVVVALARKHPAIEADLLKAFADLADYGKQVQGANLEAFQAMSKAAEGDD